jgi:hypothetical protein
MIFRMRSALFARWDGESEALLRISLSSATLRAFLENPRVRIRAAFLVEITHNLASIVDL